MATQFFTVACDGVFSPNVSVKMARISNDIIESVIRRREVGRAKDFQHPVQYTFTHKQYMDQHNVTEETERNIHNNKNTQFTKLFIIMFVGALAIFRQIGQKVRNISVGIHVRLSVKCVTETTFSKLSTTLQLLWKKTTIPNFMEIHPNVYSLIPGSRWRIGLGLQRTFSFLSYNEILIIIQFNIFYLLTW